MSKIPHESQEAKINALINKMTLQQKLGQMQCLMASWGMPEDAIDRFIGGLGATSAFAGADTVEANADFADQSQKKILPRCDIPVLVHSEAVTGLNAVDATIFPSAIGLGATWNPDTVQTMADIIRKQMLAVGVRQALSPVMDVARDPRWGRVGETYGEDPTLCAAMSVAFTKGLQSENLKDGVAATGKHFLGYGLSEGGLNMAANPIPARELREVYAKPFQAAITEGGLQSVMNSYGSIDGEMIIMARSILTNLLRDEMGFEGMVVSDYMSTNKAVDQKICQNHVEAGIGALCAGCDVEMPNPYAYTQEVVDAVKRGEISEALIDLAVRHVLRVKLNLGLFENPYARREMIGPAYDRVKTRGHSLKAARESIVLLKNNGILPLKKETKSIAVIGPHADSLRLLFGCYTFPAMIDMALSGSMSDMAGMEQDNGNGSDGGDGVFFEGSRIMKESPKTVEALQSLFGEKTPTILNAIRSKCPDADVWYEKGCDIAGTNRAGFEAAVAIAKKADVAILTLGGKYGWGNNCTTGEGIDRDRLGLTGVQEELVRAVLDTETPCVLVHMDAKPLTSALIFERCAAILENWFPGDTGGEALADVLFGDYNPAGRLPMTAARNAGQIPIYASHRNGSGYSSVNGMMLSKYVEGTKLPQCYFGEGKSYTEFSYANLILDKSVKADGLLHIACDISNTGAMDGQEVVQLYVSDEIASMLRPCKELAGFARVPIKKGQTVTVRFEVKADQFAFLDHKMDWIVEEGFMRVMIGSSSEDIRLSDRFFIENTLIIDGKKRGFYAKHTIE